MTMKKTSHPWFSQIPETWELVPIKWFTSTNTGITFTKSDLVEQGNAVLSYGQIHAKDNPATTLDSKLLRFIPDSFIEKKTGSKVKQGDFIFADTSEDVEGCGNFVYIDKPIDLYAGYHTTILRNKGLLNGRYYAYLFKSDEWRSQIRSKVKAVKLYSVTQSIINQSFILVPPLDTQQRIADYLDRECGKIDRKVELLEKKSAAYQRLRQSLINQTVTKGLNPDAPMKSSGLRWNPQIPIHWEVSRIRNFFNFRNEKVSYVDYPALSVTKNGVLPQMDNVAKTMAEGDTRKKVCKKDFVVNSRSDRKGSCGTSPLDGSVSTIYIVLEPTDIDPGFVDYYFRCNDWVEEFYRNGKGIVADLWTTNYNIMRNIEIPVPPIEEQREIAEYLDEKCGKIDAIVENITKQVQNLKTLKRALINATVTGKREILNACVQNSTLCE